MRRLLQPFLISLLILAAKQWADSSEAWLDFLSGYVLGFFSESERGELSDRVVFMIRHLIAFGVVFLAVSLVIEIWHVLKSALRRSRFVKNREEVKQLFDDVGRYHSSMEQKVRDQHVDLPEDIKGVWLEYILTDLVKALGQSFGRNDFRASVFAPFLDSKTKKKFLVSVASSIFHPVGYARSMFESGEGFCGHCFETKGIAAGSYRFGVNGLFRRNPMFADNSDELRKSSDRHRSFICLPIRLRLAQGSQEGEVVAVISIDSRNRHDFRKINGDIQFLAREMEREILPAIGRHVLSERFDNS